MFRKERYYEPEDNNDQDRIDEAVADLLNDEYSPDKYSNFAEGISEADEKDRQAVEDILSQPEINYEALGRKLYCMAYEYMESCAESRASDALVQGYLD